MGDETTDMFRSARRQTLGLEKVPIPPASRSADPPTAKLAGDSFEKRGRSVLHEAILAAIVELGPINDETLERLPRFAHCGASTVRKRRTDLLGFGDIKHFDTQPNSRGRPMMRWVRA